MSFDIDIFLHHEGFVFLWVCGDDGSRPGILCRHDGEAGDAIDGFVGSCREAFPMIYYRAIDQGEVVAEPIEKLISSHSNLADESGRMVGEQWTYSRTASMKIDIADATRDVL